MCEIPLQHTQELNTAQWKRAIQDASFIGARTISFSGGEPLLRSDIFELISCARSYNMETVLISNGTLICLETALKLAKSGISAVYISIDGNKEAHDYLRGAGVFEKALSGLNNLQKFKIKATVASMVSRSNYKNLVDVIEIAHQYGATMVKFQPFSAIFLKDKSKDNDFFINKSEAAKLKEVIERVITLAAKYGIMTNPVNYLRRIPLYLCGEKSNSRHACSALWTSCPVSPQGDVYPCWVINDADKKIGSLEKEGLCEIWLSQRHEYIRQEIIKSGCIGCMMNCYDEIFEKNETERKLFNIVRKIKNPAFYKKLFRFTIEMLGSKITRIRAWRRIVSRVKRKLTVASLNNSEEIKKTFSEIEALKERLYNEISNYK